MALGTCWAQHIENISVGSLKITPLSDLSNYQWEIFGITLLVGWILWFLAITCFTFPNVSECDSNKKALSGFFERLKFTFVVGQGIVFVRACVHPNMGFVHAQLELTIINLLLPSIYVVSLICLRMVSLLSMRAVLIDGPLALALAGIIFTGSKMTEKSHVLVVVSLFLFDRFLRSEAASSLSEMGQSLQQMLQETSTDKKHPLVGHRTAKKFVYLAVAIFLLFVGALSGFSILSVLQKSAKWFPDATSVEYEDNSIHIHHTGVVKLHLGLANKTNPAVTVDDPLYASCSNRWNGLSLIDLAFFAEAAYFDPLSNDTAEFISTIFDNELGDVHVHLPALNTKTGSKLDFFEAYLPKLNTSVISVRGTDIWRFTDFVEDVKMFFEPVVFSVLSSIFPTIRIWPDVTFSTLIELYSEMIGLFGLQHESWYYHELLDYVTSLTDRKVVLTGHSMGGGIARLVGSIVGTTSVTFSPPGFVQSYSKLVHHIGGTSMKVDRASLHHRSFAVVPEYDPITMIDAQAGMTQKISCDTPHLSMQLSCHMLEGTLCNLVEHCGSARRRISSCLFEHNIAGATEDMLPRVLATISKPEIYVSFAVTVSIALSMLLPFRNGLHAATPQEPAQARANMANVESYRIGTDIFSAMLVLDSWLYRILPPVVHEKYQEVNHPFVKADFAKEKLTPQQMRWKPMPFPADTEKLDFVDGLRTIGEPHLTPHEICVIQRGIRFSVELDGPSRGYILEVYNRHFILPDLGPIGANGLANPRDFEHPSAAYEDRECEFLVVNKYMGMIYGTYDAKKGGEDGFAPGGASLHSVDTPHGPDAATFLAASNAQLKPEKFDGGLAFMFESTYLVKLTDYALRCDHNDQNYWKCWQQMPKLFNPKKASS
ncbi:unnamed protein product [Phytophthora fragariaefolia]|uniref:homogentisate 1,2-dioxygenase n=1 Tax=Phytophthora fragariaefolia TaxID=1490495 RepID=A0A9W6XNN5_9STRA|nr:unnamed protein product [Phytophthora fragariaefolia]